MNFNQLQYWPGLLVLFSIFISIVLILEKRFFSIIKTYWFYNRSWFSYISTFLFLVGVGGLLLSVLDLRGPEEKVKMDVPTDRTIILIDTSASMLAEDVKPSRLQKSILMAKHFARKAVGQQLSIVVFAEIQKKIVPFTNDLDLIDSRLDSIKNLKNQYGSSALSLAIQESIQYFQEVGGEARGNILVFTDGEETAEGIKLKVPKDVHVALVGVGTNQGGRIPLDDSRGFRFGYKKDKGRDITTKLEENFFKQAVSDIPSGKYWLANSYSLPSEEVIAFFRSEKQKGKDSQDMIIRPVMVEWILIPSLLLIVLSYLFKFLRVFTLSLFFIFSSANAEEQQVPPTFTPQVIEQLKQLEDGKLDLLEKIKLADELRASGAQDESIALYKENLPLDHVDNKIPPEAYLNYGTSLLEKGEPQKAFKIYEQLSKTVKGEKKLQIDEAIEKNVMAYFKAEEKKKEEEKKKDQKKENKEDKDDQKQNKSGQSDQDQKKSGKQDKKESKDPSKSEEEKKEENKKQDGKDKEKEQDKDKKDEQKNDEMKNQENQKPMPPKKIPAKLKQLMYDDRQLQMKMIEQGTRDLNKRKSRKSKDW